MNRYVALLRGVNVVGKNRLAMGTLRDLLEGLGCSGVKTYLQSGNAVFGHEARDTAGLAERINEAVRSSAGFDPQVLLLSPSDMEEAIKGNPFPSADEAPTAVHVFFLPSPPPHPDLAQLERLCSGLEEYALRGKFFYLHTPDGFGRSKLAARVEKALGVPATARNWRSVKEIRALAEG